MRFGNYLIIMFKEVPLNATISVVGILHSPNDFEANNARYLKSITVVVILFLILSYISAVLIKKLEVKLSSRFSEDELLLDSDK